MLKAVIVVLMLAVVVSLFSGLFFLIKWLVQTTSRGKLETGGHGRAIDILKERYARGEIGTEEFEERKKILEGGK